MARDARAKVRAYALEHEDAILQVLLDVDGHNTNSKLMTDDELAAWEPLPKEDEEEEDSDDAAKENAGAARGSKAAAAKAVKKAPQAKKRSASAYCDDDDSDDDFKDEPPKGNKRPYVRKAAPKVEAEDQDFEEGVLAVRNHLKRHIGSMRTLIMHLGLMVPGQGALERVRCEPFVQPSAACSAD